MGLLTSWSIHLLMRLYLKKLFKYKYASANLTWARLLLKLVPVGVSVCLCISLSTFGILDLNQKMFLPLKFDRVV